MFQTLDEIDAYLGGLTIECLLCGKQYQQLGNHLRQAHALDCEGYKRQFGIPKSRTLVSDRLHEKLSVTSVKMMVWSMGIMITPKRWRVRLILSPGLAMGLRSTRLMLTRLRGMR